MELSNTRTYDNTNQLTNITDNIGTSTLLSFAYSPDAAGLVASETDTGTPNPGTTNFTYNKLQQLTAAATNNYTYDKAANLTTSPAGVTVAYSPNDQVCWTGIRTGTCTTPPTGATTFTYSNEGNRTTLTPPSGTSNTYGWNQANQLSSVTPSVGEPTTLYSYDADGLLQTETTTAGTAQYTWDTQTQLPLLLADGTNYYVYGTGTDPVEQINASTGAASWLLLDQLGSTRALTDATGTITASATYDARGNLTGSTGSLTTPFLTLANTATPPPASITPSPPGTIPPPDNSSALTQTTRRLKLPTVMRTTIQ